MSAKDIQNDLKNEIVEIEKIEKMDDLMKKFCKTYKLLVNTLTDKYKFLMQLSKHKKEIDCFKIDQWKNLIRDWSDIINNEEETKFKVLLLSKNPDLFKLNIFKDLMLDYLFDGCHLTSNSQRYIFQYISALSKWIVEMNSLNQSSEDIEPLSNSLTMSSQKKKNSSTAIPDMFNKFQGLFPSKLLNKVHVIATKHAATLKQEGKGLKNVNFAQMSKELFESIDPSEFTEVATNLGSILKNHKK
jgi:hypothetical protein